MRFSRPSSRSSLQAIPRAAYTRCSTGCMLAGNATTPCGIARRMILPILISIVISDRVRGDIERSVERAQLPRTAPEFSELRARRADVEIIDHNLELRDFVVLERGKQRR